jgi:nicotinamidase-related amidase
MADTTNHRNPHREFITPDNAAMVFIDHQAAIMTGIGDIDPVRFRNNVIALAKIAKLHHLPTVLSDNMPEGFAGPILPELVELLPDAPLMVALQLTVVPTLPRYQALKRS